VDLLQEQESSNSTFKKDKKLNAVGSTQNQPQISSKKPDPLLELEEIFGNTGASGPMPVSNGASSREYVNPLEQLLSPVSASIPVSPISVSSLTFQQSPSALTMTSPAVPFTASSSSPTTSGNLLPTSKEGLTEALKKLIMSSEGVLHQDEYLQVGFKSEYSKGMGRIMVYYGNVSAFAISSFRTSVAAGSNLNTNLQPVKDIIEPRTQVQQLIAMICVSPEFSGYPMLQISFIANGGAHSVQVRLPVAIQKFLEPHQQQAPEFFHMWKQYDGEQAIIKSPRPVDMAWLSKLLTNGCRMAVLQGVDPNTNNIVAAGYFSTSSTQNTICLLRIEANAQASMYRMTVKSPDQHVQRAMKELLEIYMGS